MKAFQYTITDPIGIHARPAGLLVKEVRKHQSVVSISKNGRRADGASMTEIMSLAAKYSDTVLVTAEGNDENEVIERMQEIFRSNL